MRRLPTDVITTARINESNDPAKHVNHPMPLINSMLLGSTRASIASRIRSIVGAYYDDMGEDSSVDMALLTYDVMNPGSTNVR